MDASKKDISSVDISKKDISIIQKDISNMNTRTQSSDCLKFVHSPYWEVLELGDMDSHVHMTVHDMTVHDKILHDMTL